MNEDTVIELRGVSRTFEGADPVHAVRRCNLDLARGAKACLMGRSGSGKSTLLNLIGLLDRPTGGDVRLLGESTVNISRAARARLRSRHVGFVFQSFHLVPYLTAVQNVELGLMYAGYKRSAREVAATRALDELGLAHRTTAYPYTLSGGEQQRVAIARATAKRPSLLLCDEPTGNLDQSSARSVLDALDELNRAGVTVLIVTHDQLVAERSGRIMLIRDGVVSTAGRLNDPL